MREGCWGVGACVVGEKLGAGDMCGGGGAREMREGTVRRGVKEEEEGVIQSSSS